MTATVIRRGLDLPISGAPAAVLTGGRPLTRVAVTADDYPLMKPRMAVSEGDSVRRGQLLFEDRKAEGVRFTAPGAGVVTAINRGERRTLQSVVIELSEAERHGQNDQVAFEGYAGAAPESLSGDAVRGLLSESGLWTAIRARPFDRVPSITESPAAVFVTAIDTHPLAGSVQRGLVGNEAAFQTGLTILRTLTEGTVWLCKEAAAQIPSVAGVETREFSGKHPAGLVGTHIHFLDPVNGSKTVWHIGWQDVIAVGRLFTRGELYVDRVVAIGGPATTNPRMVKTRLGASVSQLLAEETVADKEVRRISGSILGGRHAGDEVWDYLGRYHNQVSCLVENRERVFLGWLSPGTNKFSSIRALASRWLPLGKKRFDFTTTTHGSHRAMVPIGMFERVMPMDIMSTFLLRSLVSGDIERAEQLGCLELVEEDLALCSFVSPGKEDFGRALRRNLDEIWKESA